MLSLTERAVATALALVLTGGVAATAQSGPSAAAPAPATAVALTAPLPSASAAPAATPAAAPTTAPPSPAAAPSPRPAPAARAATRVLGPVGPARPSAGCPVAPRRPGTGTKPRPKVPAVAEALLPAPLPPGPKARSLQAVAGKGIWTTNFADDRLAVPALVRRAKAAGLRNVWVRTGGRNGYYGDRVLPRLVPAAHAAGLTVVAWDFPYLSDPVADSTRAARAFADGADAFAPDIETPAEGTFVSAKRIGLYLSLVRRAAGTRPVAATVYRPTDRLMRTFPYAAVAPYADLFVPMVYWSCKEPGALVVQSLSRLSRWLPVAPVGQAYDMGPEGGRRGTPTRGETLRFLDVAKRGGAVGASLWTYEHTGAEQWGALRDYAWER